MAKFSEYLSEIKQQTDELRLVVTEKSGTDCSGLSISEVSAVVENLSTGGRDPILQEKSVDPSTVTQDVVPDSGFDGLSKVQVNAVTSAIDSNILAGNIKKDVTILGVTGTLEQGGAEDLTEELTAQDTALTSLESAVDKLPEPKPDRLQWVCDNVKSLQNVFQNYKGESLDDVLIGLDTSQVTKMNYMFEGSKVTTIPPLDTSSCVAMYNMMGYCDRLVTISQLDLRNATTTVNMLNGCKVLTNLTLKNIKIDLQIGSGTSWGHLLTDESLINTAKELWDNTNNALGGTRTLTVSTTSKARFSEIYVKLITPTAEDIANDQYIESKKPCIVCSSTDSGAMTLQEYVISKNWTLA